MKKILGLLIPVIAAIAGIVAGDALRPGSEDAAHAAAEPAVDQHGAPAAEDHGSDHPAPAAPPPAEAHGSSGSGAGGHGAQAGAHGDAAEEGWFTFPGQFFVPLMRNGDMGAVMILTLTIETSGAELPAMQAQEHRLRDALLRELLIHANTGGFDGNFTSEARLAPLRERLHKAADASTSLTVKAVLIEDIARQEG